MANLTLTIDAELLRKARKIALDRESSVNQLVREYLERLTANREERTRKADDLVAYAKRVGKGKHVRAFTRDELYVR